MGNVYKLGPLVVVLASLIYLLSVIIDVLSKDNYSYWREIISAIVAIVGLNAYMSESLALLRSWLFGVTLRVNKHGECQCSPRQRKKLAKHIRNGSLGLIIIQFQKFMDIKERFRRVGINVDRGSGPGDEQLARVRAGIQDLSEVCGLIRLPPQGSLITDEQIASVCLGLIERKFVDDLENTKVLALASCTQSPRVYGVHTKPKEFPRFKLYMSGELSEDQMHYGVVRPVSILADKLIVNEFIPALLNFTNIYKKTIRLNGGTAKVLDEDYWRLEYWTISMHSAR